VTWLGSSDPPAGDTCCASTEDSAPASAATTKRTLPNRVRTACSVITSEPADTVCHIPPPKFGRAGSRSLPSLRLGSVRSGFSGVSASALLAGLPPGAEAGSRRGALERLFLDNPLVRGKTVNMNHVAGPDRPHRLHQLVPGHVNDDDAERQRLELVLVLESAVGGDKYVATQSLYDHNRLLVRCCQPGSKGVCT
jgi:hypothetical protein